MDKVLVLGAIEPFCDLVNEVKEKGFNPVCCDYYSFAAAKKMVELSYDISTSDVEGLYNVAKKNNVVGIVSAFSDRNLTTTLKLSEKLGFSTFYNENVINTLTDKIQMKAHFTANDIPVVSYYIVSIDGDLSEISNLEMPVIVKPVDGYGSKGISICSSLGEVKESISNIASASLKYKDLFIVEQYYDADEISVSAWVKEGKSYITSTYDVGRNIGKKVELSFVAFPSKYELEYGERFGEIIQKLTTSLGIKEGPVTLQCYIGDNGLKVGEFLYRLAGGSPYLYSMEMGGPNTAKMLVDYQTGRKIDYQNLTSFKSPLNIRYYEILVYAKKCNVINYSFSKETLMSLIDGISNVKLYHRNGEDLSDNPNSLVLVSKIFYKREISDDRSYYQIIDELQSKISITDENGNDVLFIRVPDRDFESRYWND